MVFFSRSAALALLFLLLGDIYAKDQARCNDDNNSDNGSEEN
jgi:hypothetical protein